MRQLFTSRGGSLIKSPNLRQQARRRRALTVCALLALALGSGVIGSLSRHGETLGRPHTGPFSYFPSQ